MSKSDPSDQSRINLTDSPDAIAAKIRKAKTDPLPLPDTVEALAGRPEADNLVGIFSALSGQTKAAVLKDFAGQGFGPFKAALADLVVEKLSPVSATMRRLLADPGAIDAILAAGAEKARAIAEPILDEIRSVVGFWPGVRSRPE